MNFMMRSKYLLPLIVLRVHTCFAVSNYTTYAETALSTLQTWYNDTSGLWNTCGWWNGANCMTAVAELAAVDSSVLSTATSVFANTFTQAPSVNPQIGVQKDAGPGFVATKYRDIPDELRKRDATYRDNATQWIDSCYDDDGWWALAWIAAYDLTNETCYLDTAKGIFDVMTTGGPTNCSNGGIHWCNNNAYVNAIANELYLSVAAHLATRTPASSNESSTYTSIAQTQWTWFKNSGMINAGHTINDGLDVATCENNNNTVWSYNQGVILGALVELNKAAPDGSLLPAAATIAQAAIANLTDSNHVLHEPCEPNCAPDGTQFKGIFIRNLLKLHQAAPEDVYAQVITASADSIWANDRDAGSDQLSVDWAGPYVTPANASTHSSAMEALVAAAAVVAG